MPTGRDTGLYFIQLGTCTGASLTEAKPPPTTIWTSGVLPSEVLTDAVLPVTALLIMSMPSGLSAMRVTASLNSGEISVNAACAASDNRQSSTYLLCVSCSSIEGTTTITPSLTAAPPPMAYFLDLPWAVSTVLPLTSEPRRHRLPPLIAMPPPAPWARLPAMTVLSRNTSTPAPWIAPPHA